MSTSTALPESKVQLWYDKFKDGDEQMDVTAVRRAFQHAGLALSRRTVILLVKMVDKAGHNTINFNEFYDLYLFVDSVRSSFFQVDSRGDHKLRLHDIAIALEVNEMKLGVDTIALLLKVFDHKQKGYLSLEDYTELAAFISCSRKIFDGHSKSGMKELTLDLNHMSLLASRLR